MKTLFEKIKSMRLLRNLVEFLVWVLVAIAMTYLLTFVFSPTGAFSQFPAAVMRAMLGLGILQYMISVHIPGMTTREAVKAENKTYGQIAIAFALVIGAVMMTI